MTLYNIMVYYNGEGSTNIFVPGVGDTTITNGRPIYFKNAGFNVVEALRQFRHMSIDIKINAKQDGAFRIIDMQESSPLNRLQPTAVVKEEKNVTDTEISNILSAGQSGPIPVPEKEIEKVDYSKYVIPSGKFAGKTLAEVDKEGKLKSVYNGFKNRNPEIKEAIDNYYSSLVK